MKQAKTKTKEMNLETSNEITWCPGCSNFLVLRAVKKALKELIEDRKVKREELVSVVDIGCGAKIFDYLDISGINSLHGRVLPCCFGIKLGNPNLRVLGFGGDGGTYNEGIGHLVHSSRYNSDFTMFVLNNQIFALTVGQATSTTELGFVEKTHPFGVKEIPLNPVLLALESGAGFVARLNSFDIEKNKEVIKKAILHKGFSFAEFLQPCLKFHDFSDIIKKNCYYVEPANKEEALKIARSWNYDVGKIPVGIFLQETRENFSDNYEILAKLKKENLSFSQIKSKREVLRGFLD